MAKTDVSIGLARPSEAPMIARLSRDLIESGLQWMWTPRRVASSIAGRDALVAVGRSAETIAAFGIMRYGDDDAHLDLFGVVPAFRGVGLGRRFIDWLEKPAVVAGITAVFLEVRATNGGAQAFYERLGYRRLGVLPRYYQGVESAVRMGRELGWRAHSPNRSNELI